ncbi:hypothetical protein [Draconibacterium sp.]|uniref:hypothetical protein n=1 Tax=Draconibacterium sp. TaxID=1965318 RepID=UPI00356A2ECC
MKDTVDLMEDDGYLPSADDYLGEDDGYLMEDTVALIADEDYLISAHHSLAEAEAYRLWADVSDYLKFLVEENFRINSNKPPTIRNMLLSYRTDFTLWLSPNSKQKTQGCARLTRKSYAMPTKIPETRRSSSNSSNFLTLSPLVFRLTRRGHALMCLTLHQWYGLFWSVPGVEMKP